MSNPSQVRKVVNRSRRPDDGFAERIIWRLSKSPASNSELAKAFGLTGNAFYKRIYSLMRPRKSYEISASDLFVNDDGELDRIFTLTRLELSKGIQKTKVNQSIRLSPYQYKFRNQDERDRCILIAKARAKLISSGQYTNNIEPVLALKLMRGAHHE